MSAKISGAEPKRNCSAFIFFCKENRLKEAAANPELSHKEIVGHLAEMWKGLTPEAKQQYEEMASTDKQRYLRQTEEYKKEGRYYDEAGVVVLPDVKTIKEGKKKEGKNRRSRKKPLD